MNNTPPYHTIFPPEAEKYRNQAKDFNSMLERLEIPYGGMTGPYNSLLGEAPEALKIVTREDLHKLHREYRNTPPSEIIVSLDELNQLIEATGAEVTSIGASFPEKMPGFSFTISGQKEEE